MADRRPHRPAHRAASTWITPTAPGGRQAARRRVSTNAAAASGFKQPEIKIRVHAQCTPPGPPPSAPICQAGTDVCAQTDGPAKSPRPSRDTSAPARAHANPGTLPPQPPGRQSHYDAAHDRTRALPPRGATTRRGQPDHQVQAATRAVRANRPPGTAPRMRKNGGGCPATPTSRTGASPKPRSMPRSPWPPPPQWPAWPRTAGRGPTLPEPSSAAARPRRCLEPPWGVHDVADEGICSVVDTLSKAISPT